VSVQWHTLAGAGVGHVLQVRISVTNIGASKLTLLPPPKTVMRILFPADKQTTTAAQRRNDPWWADVRWEDVPQLEGQKKPRGWVLLRNHQFIEPDETVFDDKLLNLSRNPTIVQIQTQLGWKVPRWLRKDSEVYDFVDQIFPPGTVIYDNQQNAGVHDATKEIS
jgi:hypothetical protein